MFAACERVVMRSDWFLVGVFVLSSLKIHAFSVLFLSLHGAVHKRRSRTRTKEETARFQDHYA